MLNKKTKTNRGFSLIEIMVSLAVFSIVVLVAAGALLSIIDGAKKTQALKSVINNLNFALEDMSRNLRVGLGYHCSLAGIYVGYASPADCNSGTLIAFNTGKKDASNNTVYALYEFVANGGDGYIQKINCLPTCTPIRTTAPEVKITNLTFKVVGATGAGQPRIIIALQGYAEIGTLRSRSNFNIQTTITQRAFDI